jgi:hypothetical protein
VKYHAAISFSNSQCQVKANFGKKNFKFGIEDMLSNHYKEVFDEVNAEPLDSKLVYDLVHDYLIHSGFVGTLQAFEDESSFALIRKENEEETKENEFDALKSKPVGNGLPRKKTLGPDTLALTSRDPKPSSFNPATKSQKDLPKEEAKEIEIIPEIQTSPPDLSPSNFSPFNFDIDMPDTQPEEGKPKVDLEMKEEGQQEKGSEGGEESAVKVDDVKVEVGEKKDVEMEEVKEPKMESKKSLAHSEMLRSETNGAEQSEQSEVYEIDPFFNRTVSADALNNFSKIQQRSGRSESIKNPILTNFWKMNESSENWKKIKPDQSYFKLEERGFMRHLLLERKYDEVLQHLAQTFPEVLKKDERITVAINCLKLITILAKGNFEEAIQFGTEMLSGKEGIKIPAIDANGALIEVTTLDYFSLIAYQDMATSDFAYLLQD